LAFHHRVVGRVVVGVQRGLDLLHLERRKEAVVDAIQNEANSPDQLDA